MSLETTTRSLIADWLSGLAWSTTPTLVLAPHDSEGATAPADEEDDATPRLPTIDLRLAPAEDLLLNHPVARDDSPTDQIVYEMGRREVRSEFRVTCRSEAEAEAFRDEWQSLLWLDMLAGGQTKMPVTKQLDGTFLGVTDHVRIFFDPREYVEPDSDETLRTDRWVLRQAALISYPLLVRESAPGTGRMTVKINHLRCT